MVHYQFIICTYLVWLSVRADFSVIEYTVYQSTTTTGASLLQMCFLRLQLNQNLLYMYHVPYDLANYVAILYGSTVCISIFIHFCTI